MTYDGGAGASAAAHQAAMANALKASGAIVKMEPTEFRKIVDKNEQPIVVTAKS